MSKLATMQDAMSRLIHDGDTVVMGGLHAPDPVPSWPRTDPPAPQGSHLGPTFLDGGDARQRLGLRGSGPQAVITDFGVLEFLPSTREMILVSLHPGGTLEQERENRGWPLAMTSPLAETEPPSAEEPHVLRDELATAGWAS